MTDICIFTLGCKVNQAEGYAIGDAFMQQGYTVAYNFEPAHYYIINTCAVTNEADAKSRQAISRAIKLNQKAKIFVMGCSSTFDKNAYLNKQNVVSVFGTDEKEQVIPAILQSIITARSICGLPQKSRKCTYIKIQDGCNNYCSYCIVPYLRGESRSRPIADIIAEAKSLEGKAQEILLVGINISDYNHGGKSALTQLIAEFKSINIPTKKIGSLTPTVITNELLLALQESGFAPHFHISIQSGSDSVLKRMNRKYTASQALQKIDLIRQVFEKPYIMTDIICGFALETDEEFAQTQDFLTKAQFDTLHIFPYSVREGTTAAKLPQLPMRLRRNRAKILKEQFTS